MPETATQQLLGPDQVIVARAEATVDPHITPKQWRGGLENYLHLSEFNPEIPGHEMTAGASRRNRTTFDSVIRKIINSRREKPEELVKIIASDPQSLADQIRIIESGESGDLADMITIEPGTPQAQFVEDVLNLAVEDLADSRTDIAEDLTVEKTPENSAADRQTRFQRVMESLGLSADTILGDGDQISLLFELLERYSEELSILDNYKKAELAQLTELSGYPVVPQTALIKDLERQSGVDCVPEACHNISRAAKSAKAVGVSEISIGDAIKYFNRDPVTNYAVYVGVQAGDREITKLFREHGFGIHQTFLWTEALDAVFHGRGGLLVNYGGHEVAVVGAKIDKDPRGNSRVFFLVADSLGGGNVPPGTLIQPQWIEGMDVVSSISFKSGQGTQYENLLYLVTWEREKNPSP